MINKNDVLERVTAIYTGKYKSETQFAKSISINQKTLNQQLRGERSLSLDTVLSVLSSNEDISAEWLIRGEGDMFRHAGQHVGDIIGSTAVVNHGDGNSIANNDTTNLQSKYLDLLAKKDQQIDRLLSIIEKLGK